MRENDTNNSVRVSFYLLRFLFVCVCVSDMPPRKAPSEQGKRDLVPGKDFNQECRPPHFHRLPDTCQCKPCSCGGKKPPKPVSEASAPWNAVFAKK
jgi:hypothetical protein